MDTLERAQEGEWGTERAAQEGTQVQYNNQDSHLILISHAASPASISDQVAEMLKWLHTSQHLGNMGSITQPFSLQRMSPEV